MRFTIYLIAAVAAILLHAALAHYHGGYGQDLYLREADADVDNLFELYSRDALAETFDAEDLIHARAVELNKLWPAISCLSVPWTPPLLVVAAKRPPFRLMPSLVNAFVEESTYG